MEKRQHGQNLKSVSSLFHLGDTCLVDLSALICAADCRDSEENLPTTSLVNDFKETEMIEMKPSSYSNATIASWLGRN